MTTFLFANGGFLGRTSAPASAASAKRSTSSSAQTQQASKPALKYSSSNASSAWALNEHAQRLMNNRSLIGQDVRQPTMTIRVILFYSKVTDFMSHVLPSEAFSGVLLRVGPKEFTNLMCLNKQWAKLLAPRRNAVSKFWTGIRVKVANLLSSPNYQRKLSFAFPRTLFPFKNITITVVAAWHLFSVLFWRSYH